LKVIIEAYNFGMQGSEQGTAYAWTTALVRLPNISSVVLICGPHSEKPTLEKLTTYKIHHDFIDRCLLFAFRRLPFLPFCKFIAPRLKYHRWLKRSSRLIKSLVRDSPESEEIVFLHASWASLIFGSRVSSRYTRITKRVMIGSLPNRIDDGFKRFMPAFERLGAMIYPLLHVVALCRLRGYTIICSNQGTYETVLSYKDRFNLRPVRCPDINLLDPLDRSPRGNWILFVDTANVARKGREIVRQAFNNLNNRQIDLRLKVVTKNPSFWKDTSHVEISRWMQESEFKAFVGKARYVLSASWREGTGTSLLRAMGGGAVPIVPETKTFGYLPDEARIAYRVDVDAATGLAEGIMDASRMSDQEYKLKSTTAANWAEQVSSIDFLQMKFRESIDLEEKTGSLGGRQQ